MTAEQVRGKAWKAFIVPIDRLVAVLLPDLGEESWPTGARD